MAFPFVLSAVLGAAVWALSMPLAGHAEPWDAEGPYYFVGLLVAGAISGAVMPRHLVVQYIGAVAGQAAYELVFLPVGPLFVIGLAFLIGYSFIFIAAAAIVATFRTRDKNDGGRARV